MVTFETIEEVKKFIKNYNIDYNNNENEDIIFGLIKEQCIMNIRGDMLKINLKHYENPVQTV